MRSKRGTRLAVAGLAGAAGLLAFADFQLLRSPVDISPVAPAANKAEVPRPHSPAPETLLDKKTPEHFRETVARPLFNPDRRPVQRIETAVGRPKMEPVKLRLVGVMKVGDAPARALLRFADEPEGRWIAEGGEFKGWTLLKVNENSVVVQAGERTQELKLFMLPPAPKEPVAVPRPAQKGPGGARAAPLASPQVDPQAAPQSAPNSEGVR